jgi:hypothetical protein
VIGATRALGAAMDSVMNKIIDFPAGLLEKALHGTTRRYERHKHKKNSS